MIRFNNSEVNIGLTKYKEKIFSQYYEDGMIRESLESVNSLNGGFFVDVGSWDGIYLSNTHRLARDFGYSGICIECNEERHNESIKNNSNFGVKCVNKMLSLNGESKLDKILLENECPENFDFLSIDIDGIDWWIWHSLSKFYPKVVMMEYNGNHNNCSIIEYEDSYEHLNNIDYYGATPPALNLLAENKNYDLVGMNSLNMIFIRRDLNKFPNLDLNSILWYKPWANKTERKMKEIDSSFFQKIKNTNE
jgi:hypothetical protein